MQSENKEGDVLCSGSCITNRFGRREAATESLLICTKRKYQLDFHTPAEVCGAGSWGKNLHKELIILCTCKLSTTMPESRNIVNMKARAGYSQKQQRAG